MKKILWIVVLGLFLNGNAYALPSCKGEDYTKWTNCVGTYTNDKGRKFTGEFGNDPGKRHGKGISVNKKGLKFEGEFKNDKIYKGTLYSSKIILEGKFKNGKLHGIGVATFKNLGIVEKGQWKNGLKHGYIEVNDKEGFTYKGHYKENKMHGYGVLEFQEKFDRGYAKYSAQFRNGNPISGILETKEGKYIGELKNWVPHGKGKQILSDGKIYRGIFENGSYKGKILLPSLFKN